MSSKYQPGFLLLEVLIASALGLGFVLLVWQMLLQAGRTQHDLLQQAYALQLVHNVQVVSSVSANLAKKETALDLYQTLLPDASWQLRCNGSEGCDVVLQYQNSHAVWRVASK